MAGKAAGVTPPAKKPEWRAFGKEVERRRKQFGWTQVQLANEASLSEDLSVSPSWVSQVEQAILAPRPDKLFLLIRVLGDDLADFIPAVSSNAADGQHDDLDGLAFACLWRGRVDLLTRLSATLRVREQRLRLDRLARDIDEAASTHPKMRNFLNNGRLLSLNDLAERASLGIRRMVLVELGGMKLDAPFEMKDLHGGEERMDSLEFLLDDLNLVDDLRKSGHSDNDFAAALKNAFPSANRPRWQQLARAGGPLATAQVRMSRRPQDLLLYAHDPVCWFGFQYAAGGWLVRHMTEATQTDANAEATQTDAKKTLDGLPYLAGAGALAGALLPFPWLVGAAVGLVGKNLAMTSLRPSTRHPEPGLAVEDPNAETLCDIIDALGYEWVKNELYKLVALYDLFGDLRDKGDAQLGFPNREEAVKRLERIAAALERRKDAESAASGVRNRSNSVFEALYKAEEVVKSAVGRLHNIGRDQPSLRVRGNE